MEEISSLIVRFGTQGADQLNGALRGLRSNGAGAESSVKKLTGSLVGMAAAAGGVASVGAAMQKLVETGRETGILNTQLQTATGSVDAAQAAFAELEQLTTELPTTLEETTKAFTTLVNRGLDPSRDAIISYSNTAAASGKTLEQYIEAVADAATGEFERLKEFGIKASKEGDRVALTFRGQTKQIGNNAAEIEQYLQSLGNVEFAGAATRQMETLDGKISNLGVAWDGLFRSVNEQGTGDVIADGVEIATEAIQTLTDIIKSGALPAAFDTIGSKFDGTIQDVTAALDFIGDYIGEAADQWSDEGTSATDFIADAFLNLPENIRAFVQLAAVEIAAFVDKIQVYGAEAASHLNPKNWFTDGDAYNLDANLANIESAYSSSVETILAERDKAIESGREEVEGVKLTYEAYLKEKEAKEASAKAGETLAKSQIKVATETKKTKAEIKAEEQGLKDAAKSMQQYRDDLDSIKRQYVDGYAAQQDYLEQLSRIEQALMLGDLSKMEFDKIKAQLEETRDKSEETATTMEDAFLGAFSSITSGLGEFAGVFTDAFSAITSSGGDLSSLLDPAVLKSAGTAGAGFYVDSVLDRWQGGSNTDKRQALDAAVPGFFLGTIGEKLGINFGGEESDKTQSVTVGSNSLTSGGFTGGKFSQKNRDAADLAGSLLSQMFDVIEGKTGQALGDSYNLNVGGRGFDLYKNGESQYQDKQGELGDILGDIFDDMLSGAGIVAETYKGLQGEGELLADTIGRIDSQFALVSDVADKIGLNFDAMGDSGLAAADSLIAAAGGLDAFVQGTTFFYENFFTEQEKFNDLVEQIDSTFSDLGLTVPETREEFKNLVTGLDLTTEAGQNAYASLIALSPQLDSILNQHDTWTNQLTQLYSDIFQREPDAEGLEYWFNQLETGSMSIEQISEAMSNSVEAFDLLNDSVVGTNRSLNEGVGAFENLGNTAKAGIDYVKGLIADANLFSNDLSREATLSGLSDYDKDVFLLNEWRDGMIESVQSFADKGVDVAGGLENVAIIYSNRLQDINDSIADSAEELEEAFDPTSLQIRLLKAQGKDDQALALSRQAEIDAADEAARPLLRAIYQAEDLNDLIERREGILNEIEVQQNKTLEQWLGAGREMEKLLDNLTFGSLSPLTSRQRFEAAESQYNTISEKALSGDIEAANQFDDVALQYLTQAQDRFASSSTYTGIYNDVIDKIGQVQSFASGRTAEDMTSQINQDSLTQLRTISDQIEAINTRNEGENDRRQTELITAINRQTQALEGRLIRVETTINNASRNNLEVVT